MTDRLDALEVHLIRGHEDEGAGEEGLLMVSGSFRAVTGAMHLLLDAIADDGGVVMEAPPQGGDDA